MRSILILGCSGQLGTELKRRFADAGKLVCLDRTSLDLSKEEQVRAAVRSISPELILNAAAYTAVDRAESEPELAMAINANAPRVLAEEAAQLNCLLVHYSTDYVFDGTKPSPWVETDAPSPLNVYGMSKLAGERAIEEVGGKYLIFRTSWLYGPVGTNFLLTMLRLGRERSEIRVVDDQVGAPTTSLEVARATRLILEKLESSDLAEPRSWTGVYHMTCAGATTWYGFASEIFDTGDRLLTGKRPWLDPIFTHEYPTAAKRPRNSILSNHKLFETFVVNLGDWETALREVMPLVQLEALATPGI